LQHAKKNGIAKVSKNLNKCRSKNNFATLKQLLEIIRKLKYDE